jgi:hypothetical protein
VLSSYLELLLIDALLLVVTADFHPIAFISHTVHTVTIIITFWVNRRYSAMECRTLIVHASPLPSSSDWTKAIQSEPKRQLISRRLRPHSLCRQACQDAVRQVLQLRQGDAGPGRQAGQVQAQELGQRLLQLLQVQGQAVLGLRLQMGLTRPFHRGSAAATPRALSFLLQSSA